MRVKRYTAFSSFKFAQHVVRRREFFVCVCVESSDFQFVVELLLFTQLRV